MAQRNDKVECLICKKHFKFIHHLHLRVHNISFEEYRLRFPEAKLCTDEYLKQKSAKLIGRPRDEKTRRTISRKNKANWKRNPKQGRTGHALPEESRKALSEKLKGHYVSEETRKKISETGLGREPWNKGLTKEDHDSLKATSDKVSKYNKNRSQETNHKISQTLKQKYADGMKISNSKGSYRKDLKMYFRSSWEANYARMLNFEKIEWEYEKRQFTFYHPDGTIDFVYTPDFYIGYLIEIKGHAESSKKWTCNCNRCVRDKEKMDRFSAEYPDTRLEMIGKKEYKELVKKYAGQVPKWESTK